jgi:hypothetical protein
MRPDVDAYRRARVIREGCKHMLGCKCDPPYWLRASTAAEQAHEASLTTPKPVELDYEQLREFAP